MYSLFITYKLAFISDKWAAEGEALLLCHGDIASGLFRSVVEADVPRIDTSRANPIADTAVIGYSILADLCTSGTELEDDMEDASPQAQMKADAEDSHPLERSNLLHIRPICDMQCR